LAQIDLATADEITVVLNNKMKPDDLALLPVDKVRLSLPPINRTQTAIPAKLIRAFFEAGFHKWEAGNPGALTLIPTGADIAFDFTLSMLNSQAMAQAFDMGASRVTFSVEDTADNIATLSRLTDRTCLVVYQDVPLFLSDNCVRQNACADCPRGLVTMPLENERGRFTLISKNCQTVVVRDTPLCLMPDATTIVAGWYRVDFCHMPYTAEKAARIWETLRAGKAVKPAFTGNFQKKFA